MRRYFALNTSSIPKELQIFVLYNLSPARGLNDTQKAVLIVSSCIRQEPKHKSRQQMIAYSAKDAEWTGPTVNLGQVTYYLGGKSEF